MDQSPVKDLVFTKRKKSWVVILISFCCDCDVCSTRGRGDPGFSTPAALQQDCGKAHKGPTVKGKPDQAAYFHPTRDLQEIPLCQVVSGGNQQLRVVEGKKTQQNQNVKYII